MNRFFWLVLIILTSGIQAQDRPLPGTVEVPEQVEEDPTDEEAPITVTDSEEKLGAIRIWNFSGRASGEALGISLLVEGQASGAAPVILARGLRYGRFGNYIAVPEGNHRLHVFPDPVETFDPEVPVSVSGPGRVAPSRSEIEINPDSYQTVLLFDDESELGIRILDDSFGSQGEYALRLLNLTGEANNKITQISGDSPKVIADNLSSGEFKIVSVENPSRADYEFQYSDAAGFVLSQSIEVESEGLMSNSFLIHYDRYGRMTLSAFNDAPLVSPVNPSPELTR